MSIINLEQRIYQQIYWGISSHIYRWFNLTKYYDLMKPFNDGLDIIELPFRRLDTAVRNNIK
jgi:hypothetical protein